MSAVSSKRPKQVWRVTHRVLNPSTSPPRADPVNSTNTSSPLTKGHWLPPRMQHLAPVVQTLDSAIHRINHYPADK